MPPSTECAKSRASSPSRARWVPRRSRTSSSPRASISRPDTAPPNAISLPCSRCQGRERRRGSSPFPLSVRCRFRLPVPCPSPGVDIQLPWTLLLFVVQSSSSLFSFSSGVIFSTTSMTRSKTGPTRTGRLSCHPTSRFGSAKVPDKQICWPHRAGSGVEREEGRCGSVSRASWDRRSRSWRGLSW